MIGLFWGDFDNDGWLDLMVGYFVYLLNFKVFILKNNGVNRCFIFKEWFINEMY